MVLYCTDFLICFDLQTKHGGNALIHLPHVICESWLVLAPAVTALTQPSLADAVRPHSQPASLTPASTAPPARTTRVTTAVTAGQVHEALLWIKY